MNIHDDPDDIEYSKAMELQMPKFLMSNFTSSKAMPQKSFLHLDWTWTHLPQKIHLGDLSRLFLILQKAMMAIQSC